jgi:hypothetical protein
MDALESWILVEVLRQPPVNRRILFLQVLPKVIP